LHQKLYTCWTFPHIVRWIAEDEEALALQPGLLFFGDQAEKVKV
jgi:hypothetical protein